MCPIHIPDGFLNITTAATTYAISAGGITYAVKTANKKLGEKHVPLMGVMAAFIFATQMLNFPVVGGTSGHFLGAALAAILLGPRAGILIMSCVLLVQCLIFQDGGLIALGANVFNMGIVGCLTGYYTYKGITWVWGEDRKSMLIGGAAASWASVVIASITCAAELSISGTVPWDVALPAMGGVHALISIGEGLITAAVLSLVLATRADLIRLEKV